MGDKNPKNKDKKKKQQEAQKQHNNQQRQNVSQIKRDDQKGQDQAPPDTNRKAS
jgi:hypothetical protein